MRKIDIPLVLEELIKDSLNKFKDFYAISGEPQIQGCYDTGEYHDVLRVEINDSNNSSIVHTCYATPYIEEVDLERIIAHKNRLIDSGAKFPQIITSDNDKNKKEVKYIVEEELKGPSLKEYLRNPNTSIAEIINMYEKIGEEVGKIHYTKMFHGDLHTDNVIILNSNRVGIIDPETNSFKDDKLMHLQKLDIAQCLYHSLYHGSIEFDLDENEIIEEYNSDIPKNYEKIIDSFLEGYSRIMGNKNIDINKNEVIKFTKGQLKNPYNAEIKNSYLRNGLTWEKLYE